MSILIHGMEMPKSCITCYLNFGEKRPEYGLTIYCPYSDGVISWRDKAFDNGRLSSCGIAPVPTHGRLVDGDALYKIIKKRTRNWAGGWSDIECVLTGNDIKNAPTIIPAEE